MEDVVCGPRDAGVVRSYYGGFDEEERCSGVGDGVDVGSGEVASTDSVSATSECPETT